MLQEFVDGTANVEDEPRSPYSLSKEEADEITARFIKLKAEEKIEKKADNFFTKILDVASHKGSGGFDFYRVSGASEVASAARSLERRVFEARFGNDAVEMDREYGPYDPQSDFFIAIDKESRYSMPIVIIFSAIAAGSFSYILGGNFYDVLSAAFIGLLIKFLSCILFKVKTMSSAVSFTLS